MTAIAVFWTPKEIIVAADSKVHSSDGKPGKYDVCCKIRQENTIFFTFSGLGEHEHTGFDAEQLIRQALRVKGSFKDKLAEFERTVVEPLTASYQAEYELNRKFFDEYLDDSMGLEVIFFGVEQDKLFICRRGFEVVRKGETISMRSCQNNQMPAPGLDWVKFEGWLIPEGELQDEFVEQNPVDLVKSDPAAAARRFIELIAMAKPEHVAPPIDIIRVTKDRAKWLRRKPSCPDIEPFK